MPYTPFATSDYANLGAAITDIGAAPATLYIDSAIDLTANLVIPATLSIVDTREGYIVQTAAFTLTINGPFIGYADLAFSGFSAAEVTFGNGIERVLPEWWATNTTPGTTDMASAIQSAVSSITTGIVKFGVGIYKIVTSIVIGTHRIKLVGCGPQSTKLYFAPASAIPMLSYIEPSNLVLYQNGLEDLTCYNNGYAGSVAVRLTDTSEFYLHRVAIYPWTGANSIGLQLRGRELPVFDNIEISATLPISIEDNPNSTIDLDQCIFRDTYLIAGTNQPCVKVADGVNITNLNFEGRNAWIPSNTHAFYWNDTTSAAVSMNLNFKNIRLEQETEATSYMFYINHNYNIQNLIFENIYGGLTQKGYYLRNILSPTFINCSYINGSNNEGLNVDSSILNMSFFNSWWQSGTTAILTGQRLLFGTPKYPNSGAISNIALYDSTNNADQTLRTDCLPTYTNNTDALSGGLISGQMYRTSHGIVMVVFTPDITGTTPTTGGISAMPFILYDNRFEDGIPNATGTAAGYSSININDWKTYTFWKGTAADPMYLTVDCGVGTMATTGANLITNGSSFTGGPPPTDWGASDCTLAAIAGGEAGNCLELTSTGGDRQYARFNFTTVKGKTYRVAYYVKSGTAGDDAYQVGVADASAGTVWGGVTGTSSGAWVSGTFDFLAGDTDGYIYLMKNTTHAGSPGTMLFDTVSIYELSNVPLGNALGIQSHNLSTVGATVSVECSGNNAYWTEALAGFAPSDNLNILKEFARDYYARYWRVKITGHSAAPQLAICCVGEAMAFPTPPTIPVVPYEISVSGEGKLSKTGALLGAVIRNKPVRMEYVFKGEDYTYTWVHGTFMDFWVNHAALLKPFFFALDLTNFTDAHWLCRIPVDGTYGPPMSFLSRVDDLSFEMEALWGD
jgi:hypothetical protein